MQCEVPTDRPTSHPDSLASCKAFFFNRRCAGGLVRFANNRHRPIQQDSTFLIVGPVIVGRKNWKRMTHRQPYRQVTALQVDPGAPWSLPVG